MDPGDPSGKPCRLEVLGEGQQFVAHAVHPETREPYRWVGDRGPHTIPRLELPELTEEQARAAVAEFERYALEHGWRPYRRAEGVAKGLPAPAPAAGHKTLDADDWTTRLEKPPLGLSADTVRQKLALIPAFEGYEDWLSIGAALHHEFQHDPDTGLELFIEYSSWCSNFDEKECDEKWRSFGRSGEHGAKTARWIVKLANEVQRKAATEGRKAVEDALLAALTPAEVVAAANLAKRTAFDEPTRHHIAGLLRDTFKQVTGIALGLRDARKMVRYEDPDAEQMLPWLRGWVYCTMDSTFYRREDGELMTRQAFNDAHARKMLSRRDVLEGRTHPENPPVEAALNRHQIPVVRGRLYMPSECELFSLNGAPHVNTYSGRPVPEVPAEPSPQEAENVEIAKAHFEHLFADERERGIVVSYLAYVVQTMKRPNFALLLQGLEGDGKSWIFHLMCAVLGPENVRSVDAGLLKRDFTAWAEGVLLNFFEEIRLLSENRYEILNRIKPYITNAFVSVHHKGQREYLVPNTAGYILLTNYRDALPLHDGDSRYFVAWSRWQDPAAFRVWMKPTPQYYTRLYRAVEQSAGALRGWLLGYPLHPDFDPNGRAPASASERRMLAATKPDDLQAIEDALAESKRADISGDLLNATALAEMLDDAGVTVPQTTRMNWLLGDLGFTYVGRAKANGPRRERFWSKRPSDFTTKEGKIDAEAVRAWIQNGGP